MNTGQLIRIREDENPEYLFNKKQVNQRGLHTCFRNLFNLNDRLLLFV